MDETKNTEVISSKTSVFPSLEIIDPFIRRIEGYYDTFDFSPADLEMRLARRQSQRIEFLKAVEDNKLLTPEERVAVSIATEIAPIMDEIYGSLLNNPNYKIDNKYVPVISRIGNKYIEFFDKHPLWGDTLKLIKQWVNNPEQNTLNTLRQQADTISQKMLDDQGLQLIFYLDNWDYKATKEEYENPKYLSPFLMLLIPGYNYLTKFNYINTDEISSIYFGYSIVQAGDAVTGITSAIRTEKGELIVINNFQDYNAESIKSCEKILKASGIDFDQNEVEQCYANFLILHELGHPHSDDLLTDDFMETQAEWLSSRFMYKRVFEKILNSKQTDTSEMKKNIIMLLNFTWMTHSRLHDKDAEFYVQSDKRLWQAFIDYELLKIKDGNIVIDINKEKIKQIITFFDTLDNEENIKIFDIEIENNEKELSNYWKKWFGE